MKYFCVENLRRGMIRVWNKGKYRVIIIPTILKKKLLIYIEKKKIKKGIIFCTRTGKEKDRSNIWREMKKIASCQESVWKRYSRTTCGIFSQEHSTERRKTLFI